MIIKRPLFPFKAFFRADRAFGMGKSREWQHKYRRNTLFHFSAIGQGVYSDFKDRFVPYYMGSVTDAYNYRVVPATVYIFFTNLFPAIAFAQDMFDHTNNSYGVNEILLSSGIGGVVFGLLSGSPLCIVGVTGPVAIFSYTVYELVVPRGTAYFPFMAWICLWSMLMHFVLAFGNFVNFMRYVTRFSCHVFGLFINVVYMQKGVEILTRQFHPSDNGGGGFASVVLALCMAILGVSAIFFGTKTHHLPHTLRVFIRDYSTPLSVVFFTGFIHFGGYLSNVEFTKLPITRSFHPTDTVSRDPNWFIYFWRDISVGDIFLAIPFAFLLTILFYYDHNISSLICHSNEFPIRKPVTFHYDFFLLGVTTGLAGILGIPPPNGLIPQAPLHTKSLCVHDRDNKITSVVEQRLSNTMQGVLTIGMMTRPMLVVLGQIPQGVLAGLFWIMAIPALDANEIVNKIRFLCLDPKWKRELKHRVLNDETLDLPFPQYYFLIPTKVFIKFTILSLIAFAGEFAITCTKGAIGFPGVLMVILIFVQLTFTKIFGTWLELLDGNVVDQDICRGLWIER